MQLIDSLCQICIALFGLIHSLCKQRLNIESSKTWFCIAALYDDEEKHQKLKTASASSVWHCGHAYELFNDAVTVQRILLNWFSVPDVHSIICISSHNIETVTIQLCKALWCKTKCQLLKTTINRRQLTCFVQNVHRKFYIIYFNNLPRHWCKLQAAK